MKAQKLCLVNSILFKMLYGESPSFVLMLLFQDVYMAVKISNCFLYFIIVPPLTIQDQFTDRDRLRNGDK